MAYATEVTPPARRWLRRAQAQLRERLQAAINELADDPRHRGVRAVRGGKLARFRVRVGDHRILFEIDDRERVVYIVRVGHRDSIYPRRPRE